MRVRIALLWVFALAFWPMATACADSWSDPDLGRWLIEGAADERRLWLLGESGAVVEFDRRSGARRRLADGVEDLLLHDGALWALRKDAQVSRLDGSGRDPPTLQLDGAPVALFYKDGGLGVLATGGFALLGRDGWRATRLSAPVDPYGARLAVSRNGDLYLGYDRGEWGGGLRRIDPTSGQVSLVAERGNGDLCDGLLNPDCDPVQNLAPDPANPDCVLVATGLAHGVTFDGRILRVCGSQVTDLFSAPRPSPVGLPGLDATWVFSDFAVLGDGWVATAEDRLFRAEPGGGVRHDPPVPLKAWSGLRLNDDDPAFIVVMSSCCSGPIDNPTTYRLLLAPVAGG